MRDLKKLLATGLAASMVLTSLAGCGSDNTDTTQGTTAVTTTSATEEVSTEPVTEAADEKPYKGMNFVIMIRDDMESRYGPEANAEFKNDHYQTIYHALNEWCLENEATWSQLATQDVNVLMSAVAAGQGPDLYFHYYQFPLLPNLGLAQPIDEYYDQLAEKYGAQYLDIMNYKGSTYGVHLPFNGYGSMVYYRDVLEEYGVKTPREYFMEGNWTWDAVREITSEITKDLDGDGALDMVGLGTNYIHRFWAPFQQVNEDGSLTSLLNTDRNMYLYQMMYEEHTVNGTWTHANITDCLTVMTIQSQITLTDPSSIVWEDESTGHIREAVPLPPYEEGEAVSVNLFDSMVPTGAQSLEASISMLDYLLECCCEVAFPDRYDFVGLRGTTEESAAYLEMAKEGYQARVEKTMAMPEYDAAYIDAITEYLGDKAIWSDATFSGVSVDGKVFWQNPPSTVLAEIYPVHQAQCETYNSLYIYN